MGWRASLKSYFQFNKRERNGALFLLGILILVISIRIALPIWFKPEIRALSQNEVKELQQLNSQLVQVENGTVNRQSKPEIEWTFFDPNSLSQAEFEQLGLPDWLALRIVNYREKVRPFQSKEELLKVYGMDSAWWSEAEPYIKLSASAIREKPTDSLQDIARNDTEPQSQKLKKSSANPLPNTIDLNKADTLTLMQIPGIGPFYAKQIVKQRDLLGGYFQYEQLMDIYRIRDEALDALARYTFIDTASVQRMNINSATVKSLGMHPYLSWIEAKAIVNYRKQHGVYDHVKEIMQTDVVTDSVYLKIAPYLKVR